MQLTSQSIISFEALYTREAILQLEALVYSQLSLTPYELMQRAGRAAFQKLKQQWPTVTSIIVCCGGGNNGGDGYVIARLAHEAGLKVIVQQLGDLAHLPEPANQAYQACLNAGVAIQSFSDIQVLDAEVIVDALLGIGIKGPIHQDYLQAITWINQTNLPVLALDVPSGVEANTGHVIQNAVKATITVCFIGLKQGLLTGDAVDYVGGLNCERLGLPATIFAQVPSMTALLSLNEIQALLPSRKRNSHKGNYGHVLVVGGDYGMAGAARMAAEAAARIGAGLVTVATRPEHVAGINAARPELLCFGITQARALEPLLTKASVIIVGPGLGQSNWSQELLGLALQTIQPKVIDADALNLITAKPLQRQDWILTPHPGEAARLLQSSISTIQADRFCAVKELQLRYGGVAILKGAGSLIRSQDKIYLSNAGNPGMASGGMGDVLSGMIGGLLAQGLSLEQAACAGVMFHAEAGDRVARKQGERGMLALDLLTELGQLINSRALG